MIVCLARPRFGQERTIVSTEGIAIEMIVDKSPSMQALDFRINGEPVDRLTAVKNVATRFVIGEDSLQGRPSDLIGLTSFSGYADNISPLTLDHYFLIDSLRAESIVQDRGESGTAIGDAIAFAVEKLKSLELRNAEKSIKSRIAILLTDGENNAGELDPMAAADLATAIGIKIYTIGVGTKDGEAKIPITNPLTGRTMLRSMAVSIDEDTLTAVAEKTGGKYFRATDTDSLIDIYQEIDQLEKSNVESRNLADYRELAVQSTRLLGFPIPPLLAVTLFLFVVNLILKQTWLRQFS